MLLSIRMEIDVDDNHVGEFMETMVSGKTVDILSDKLCKTTPYTTINEVSVQATSAVSMFERMVERRPNNNAR